MPVTLIGHEDDTGEDPDHFLVFTFIESDIGFDHLEPDNRVVLGEYELTPDRETSEVIAPHYPDDAVMLNRYKLPPGAKMIGE